MVKMMDRSGVQLLKVVHLLFAFMWLGGAAALLLVNFLAQPETGDELYMKLRAMQVIDDFLIIPGAMGNLLVGVVYGVFTRWGFFQHRWITVKWVLTVAQILFGTFFLGPWLNGNVETARETGLEALNNDQFQANLSGTAIGGIVQLTLLCLYLYISVYKPWKRKSA